MGVEVFPQVAAIGLAAGGALSDALAGKVYNRWLLVGVGAGMLWLAAVPLVNALGGEAEYVRFPELGLWSSEEAERAAAEPAKPAPWEAPPADRSVWPPPEGSVRAEDGALEPRPTASAWVYAAKVLANAGLALIAGFLMWWFGLWAAGDAKMFAVLAFLLPLSTYRNAYMPLFPAYVLLFNTFASVIAILALEMLARIVRQVARPTDEEVQVARETAVWVRTHAAELAMGFVAMLFLFIAIKTARGLFRDVWVEWTGVNVKPVVYLILLLVFHPLVRLMRDRRVLLSVAILTAAYVGFVIAFPSENHDLRSVLSMGSIAATIMLFYLVYGVYLNVFDFKSIRVWELKPRMILARRTLEVLKEDQDLLDRKLGAVGPDGLTAEQVETLRRWWIDRGKGGVLWVSRTFPFAPALLAGTVATVWVGGYVVWT